MTLAPRMCAVMVALALAGCEGVSIRALDPAAGPDAATSQACVDVPGVPVVTALAADDFVDSVGLNLRLDYLDTPYADLARVGERIAELGVRHLIDTSTTDLARLARLTSAGPRAHVWVTRQEDFRRVAGALGDGLAALYVGGMRPANASDTWLRTHTLDLAMAKQAESSVSRLPLAAPSLGSNEANARAAVDLLGDLSPWLDHAVFSPVPQVPWSDRSQTLLDLCRRVVPGKPVLAPQAGISTATGTGVDETTQARYLQQLLLTHFRAGVRRTFISQLVDIRSDRSDYGGNFGLARHDWSPKPAFHAVRRLLARLSDPGAPVAPRSLPLAIETGTTPVRSLLFQKRSGLFLLALWSESTTTAAVTATVRFGEPVKATRLFRPGQGDDPVSTNQEVTVLPLELVAGAALVEIESAGCARP